jgi:hypothetical protein
MEETLKPTIYGWGIKDVDYVTYTNGAYCPYYLKWRSLIERGHSEKCKEKHPTYQEVSVNLAWKYLSTFKTWMEKQYWEGCDLDKDILVKGNKEYGPTTCVFVPQHINKLLNVSQQNSSYPIGVSVKDCSGRGVNPYVAQCRDFWAVDKSRHLGRFPTALDAHRAWQLAKADVIEAAILRYMLEPCYRQDVANAIYLRAEMLRDDHANHRETFSL